MVKPQQEAQSSDRTVMLDMNKSGSGGFFNYIVYADDWRQRIIKDYVLRP